MEWQSEKLQNTPPGQNLRKPLWWKKLHMSDALSVITPTTIPLFTPEHSPENNNNNINHKNDKNFKIHTNIEGLPNQTSCFWWNSHHLPNEGNISKRKFLLLANSYRSWLELASVSLWWIQNCLTRPRETLFTHHVAWSPLRTCGRKDT